MPLVDDLEALKSDPLWLASYRRGQEIQFLAWGWSLARSETVPQADRDRDQKWQNYPVRFAKAAYSAILFRERDLVASMRLFGATLSLNQLRRDPEGRRAMRLLRLDGYKDVAMPADRY